MGCWHYQLMKRKLPEPEADISGYEYEYGIYEYYITEEGNMHTQNPIVFGESVEDVKGQLKLILLDIDKHGIKDYD